eukprot:7055361-Pyramimonas_sp.AAC.1
MSFLRGVWCIPKYPARSHPTRKGNARGELPQGEERGNIELESAIRIADMPPIAKSARSRAEWAIRLPAWNISLSLCWAPPHHDANLRDSLIF